MRKFLVLILALLIPIAASASTNRENLRKCWMIARMTDRQLLPVARSVHATVREIRQACYVLTHPSHYRGGGRASPPQDSTPTDSCGGCSGGDICMFIPGGWTCVFHSSPNNVCHTAGDCENSLCQNGMCR